MTPIVDLIPALMRGAVITIEITLLSALLALIVAFIAGFGRLSRFKTIRFLTGVYVEFFRGTSLLVQLFWLFFVLPFFNIHLSAMVAGVLALGLNYGAYGSEVVRSSIQAVPRGQTEAGIALNMTPYQRMRRIILPQAKILMLPPFGNLLIELLKGTALVSLITIPDLTYQALMLNNATFQTIQIFTLLLVFYFAIAYPLTMGVRWLERRATVGRL